MYKKARAKINLTLNILDKRPDGYHNLESVFQIISLYDELFVEKTDNNTLEINCNFDDLQGEDNIIFKAYSLLKEKHENIFGIKVTLKKNIPVGRGLAGGSSNCASFLVCMNKLFDLNYSKEELINIGKTLGADVPPCMYTGAIFAKGIGEIITKVDTDLKYYIVIATPDFSLSTKLMFEKLDEIHSRYIYDSQNAIGALKDNNLGMLCDNLYNDFEKVLEKDSEILVIKKLMIENGALASLLCGSGSSVFGIFDDKEKSKLAYEEIKKSYTSFWCFSTRRKKHDK